MKMCQKRWPSITGWRTSGFCIWEQSMRLKFTFCRILTLGRLSKGLNSRNWKNRHRISPYTWVQKSDWSCGFCEDNISVTTWKTAKLTKRKVYRAEHAERAETFSRKCYFVKIHLENCRQVFAEKRKCFFGKTIIFW